MEMTMRPVLDIKPVRLSARAVHRIEAGKGLQITGVSGAVWITQARDARDVIVVGPAGHIEAADFAAPAAWGSAA
jgi:hypothetical protein